MRNLTQPDKNEVNKEEEKNTLFATGNWLKKKPKIYFSINIEQGKNVSSSLIGNVHYRLEQFCLGAELLFVV